MLWLAGAIAAGAWHGAPAITMRWLEGARGMHLSLCTFTALGFQVIIVDGAFSALKHDCTKTQCVKRAEAEAGCFKVRARHGASSQPAPMSGQKIKAWRPQATQSPNWLMHQQTHGSDKRQRSSAADWSAHRRALL